MNLSVCFAAGPGYVQFFSTEDPGDVARDPYRLGDNRTALLGDHSTNTCIHVTMRNNDRFMWMKLMPLRSYLFQESFSVFIVGRSISCSPIDGVAVAVQPTCGNNGTCDFARSCVAKWSPNVGEQDYCQYSCIAPVDWDFVVIYVKQPWPIQNTLITLCEVWFSN